MHECASTYSLNKYTLHLKNMMWAYSDAWARCTWWAVNNASGSSKRRAAAAVYLKVWWSFMNESVQLLTEHKQVGQVDSPAFPSSKFWANISRFLCATLTVYLKISKVDIFTWSNIPMSMTTLVQNQHCSWLVYTVLAFRCIQLALAKTLAYCHEEPNMRNLSLANRKPDLIKCLLYCMNS